MDDEDNQAAKIYVPNPWRSLILGGTFCFQAIYQTGAILAKTEFSNISFLNETREVLGKAESTCRRNHMA